MQLSARFVIHEGKLEAFKALAKECMASVKEKDTDTSQYDWYFSADNTECVVRETYTDSNAILSHIGNLGELFGRLLEISDLYPEVYGDPSEELVNATAALKPKVYSFYQGL